MIYRIRLSRDTPFYKNEDDAWNDKVSGHEPRRSGTAFNLSDEMDLLGLPPPKVKMKNRRARFYFTERGWDEFGRRLFAIAKKRGLNPTIVRKKNPKRSDVVYGDLWQVAVLP